MRSKSSSLCRRVASASMAWAAIWQSTLLLTVSPRRRQSKKMRAASQCSAAGSTGTASCCKNRCARNSRHSFSSCAPCMTSWQHTRGIANDVSSASRRAGFRQRGYSFREENRSEPRCRPGSSARGPRRLVVVAWCKPDLAPKLGWGKPVSRARQASNRTPGPPPALAYQSGGYAFFISSWNCAENHAPDSGAFGSAPDKLLPLRALPV